MDAEMQKVENDSVSENESSGEMVDEENLVKAGK